MSKQISISTNIIEFLKANGPQLDSAIAERLHIPLGKVRSHVEDLSLSGELVCCHSITFRDGARIEGLSCRVSCYMPPAARGRKPAAVRKAEVEPVPD